MQRSANGVGDAVARETHNNLSDKHPLSSAKPVRSDFAMAEEETRYRKFATLEQAFKAHLRGDRERLCIYWGRWRELMRVWNYMVSARHEIIRRTALLDDVRENYLKDVWAVKSALAAATKAAANKAAAAKGGGGALLTGATAEAAVPSAADATPSLDLRGWGKVPERHRAGFDELEMRGYLKLAGLGDEAEAKRPGFDLVEEKSVPCYGPNECAFLSYKCEKCAGVLALVYARNQRVSAALGLVATWEQFQADTKDQLDRIPGLEKQARVLREQAVAREGVLGAAELRGADLDDQLQALQRKYTSDVAALTQEKEHFEKMAARVPVLEEQVTSLKEDLAASEAVAAERADTISTLERAVSKLQKALADAHEKSAAEIARRDRRIAGLERNVAEGDERTAMAGEELRFERAETIPALRREVASLNDDLLEAARAQQQLREDMADLRLKLGISERLAESLQSQLTTCRAELKDALTPPKTRNAEVQASPKTSESGMTFSWATHLTPKAPSKVVAVSATLTKFSDAPAAVTAKQTVVELGFEAGCQATAEVADACEQVELPTAAEIKLTREVEEALDRIEDLEERLAAAKKSSEAYKVRLKACEMDNEELMEAKEEAQALTDAIEQQTSDRLNGLWASKFRMQGMIHKMMLNTQQSLTNKLAGMLNGLKAKINLQSKFLTCVTEGKTKDAQEAELKPTGMTPSGTPTSSRPGSARESPGRAAVSGTGSAPGSRPASARGGSMAGPPPTAVPEVPPAAGAASGSPGTSRPSSGNPRRRRSGPHAAVEDPLANETGDDGVNLELGGKGGETNTLDADAEAMEKFQSVLEDRLADMAERRWGAGVHFAWLLGWRGGLC